METGAKIPLSLAEMCVEKITQNIGSYKKSLKRKLAPPAREMVLHKLTKNAKRTKGPEDAFAKVWADLPFLLNSRTKKFRSRWLTDMLENSVPSRPLQPILRQLLVHLSEQAPNLECLEIIFSNDVSTLRLDNREVFAIQLMEKLTKIVINNVTMKLSDFRTITIKCNNLQKISVNQIEIEEIPTFEENSYEKFPVQEISVWQEKCIGIHLSSGAISNGYRFLTIYPSRNISQLISFIEKLTTLTRLELDCCDLEDEDTLEEFPCSLPSLDSAEIYDSRGNLLRKFLERNGEKLDKLCISSLQEAGEEMSYAQLFNWCPKLKDLNLRYWQPTGNNIRINCLQQLQHIEIYHYYENDCEDEGGPVLQVSCVLSAPNLLTVEINVRKVHFGHYWSFVTRITRREIFTNLKFLSLCDKDHYAFYNESIDEYEPYFGGRVRLEELENAIKLSR